MPSQAWSHTWQDMNDSIEWMTVKGGKPFSLALALYLSF
jgi:hypothetical protein